MRRDDHAAAHNPENCEIIPTEQTGNTNGTRSFLSTNQQQTNTVCPRLHRSQETDDGHTPGGYQDD